MASKSNKKISTITDRIHNSVVSILNETIRQPSPNYKTGFSSASQSAGSVAGGVDWLFCKVTMDHTPEMEMRMELETGNGN